MKKLFSLLLVLTMSICMCVPAYATSTDDNLEVSDTFIYACDLFFSGKGEVYNQSGVDISDSFYDSFKDEYSVGNFSAIMVGCRSYGVSCIKTHNETPVQSRRLELTKTYEEMSYHLITQEGILYDGKTWGFVVRATGSFTYQDSTLQISSYTYPSITYSYDGLGTAFTGSVTSSRVIGPSFVDNRSALAFTVEATHEVCVPIPGLDLVTDTIGPYDTVSKFEISVL